MVLFARYSCYKNRPAFGKSGIGKSGTDGTFSSSRDNCRKPDTSIAIHTGKLTANVPSVPRFMGLWTHVHCVPIIATRRKSVMRAIAKWVARVFAVALLLTVPGIRAQKDEVVHDENVYLSDFAELDYPVLARQAHVEGVVVVRVGLDSQGDVISSAPISGNKLLIPDCLENAKKWRFQPSSPKTVIIVYEF